MNGFATMDFDAEWALNPFDWDLDLIVRISSSVEVVGCWLSISQSVPVHIFQLMARVNQQKIISRSLINFSFRYSVNTLV